jgi:methionyl-tRNA formyltransferase
MRILFLGNTRVGVEALRELIVRGENVVGLAVHPADRQRCAAEIRSLADLPEERVFDGSALQTDEVFQAISALRPDLAVSVFFGYILRAEFIDLFPRGVINLHPSYLPFNRGQYPNVWSIVEETPAGATLHYIDSGVDTGDIIAQRQVDVEPIDTGESLYEKLQRCCTELFREQWPSIKDGTAGRSPQPRTGGTFHRTRDVEEIDRIDLDQKYKARDLINILRARTFPPYRGAYFVDKGRRIGVRIDLGYEDDALGE